MSDLERLEKKVDLLFEMDYFIGLKQAYDMKPEYGRRTREWLKG